MVLEGGGVERASGCCVMLWSGGTVAWRARSQQGARGVFPRQLHDPAPSPPPLRSKQRAWGNQEEGDDA
jgi:hypothetical protein